MTLRLGIVVIAMAVVLVLVVPAMGVLAPKIGSTSPIAMDLACKICVDTS